MKSEIITYCAIGMGSVISGYFFGWTTLLSSGIGLSLLSFIITSYLYFIIMRSIATLTINIKNPLIINDINNIYLNIENELDKTISLLYVSCECIKLNFIIASVAVAVVHSISEIFDGNLTNNILVSSFCILYSIFCIINMFGQSISSNIQRMITLLCILLLLFYIISLLLNTFDFNKNALNNNNIWFNSSFNNIFLSFPYSTWLFIGFEEIPSLSGNNDDKNISMILCFFFSLCSGLITIIIASGSSPGIIILSNDQNPVISGLIEVFGNDSIIVYFIDFLIVVIVFSSSFLTFVMFSSEQLKSISKQEMLPNWLGLDDYSLLIKVNDRKNKDNDNDNNKDKDKIPSLLIINEEIPSNALIIVGLFGMITVSIFTIVFGVENVQQIFVTATLVPTMISYLIQLHTLHKNLKIDSSNNFNNNKELIPLLNYNNNNIVIIENINTISNWKIIGFLLDIGNIKVCFF